MRPDSLQLCFDRSPSGSVHYLGCTSNLRTPLSSTLNNFQLFSL